ncbi:DUF3014 domain-containing protein [Ferrimonas lipolytica]|uniref:DUF3014 domain-containing protein n=1 Tax=Ferrimonas lipolytica TaxID=2724191 RepID=A0A6H1UI87_9GAMM|nr:DUF3014 domain-containing protein [Ferrimonas lipolytica]QIZ78320.1 DUF3014 domain-containing protein [Ferrimonas lipolytica]
MYSSKKSNNINKIAVGLLALTVIVCAIGWYFLSRHPQSEPIVEVEPIAPVEIVEPTLPIEPLPVEPVIEPIPEPEPEPILEPEPVAEPEPVIEPEPEVVVPEPEPEPLPPLNSSDDMATSLLNDISDGMRINGTLRQDNLLRRLTMFVDNLTSGEVMRSQGPLLPLIDSFPVIELNNRIFLDPDGYRRFDQMADFLYRLDEEKTSDAYLLIEPLLEEAYQELGYEQGQFRSTLFTAIDQILAAPETDSPLALTSPSVNYKFEDESLESLPDAQKVMLRMGSTNTRKVKSFLKRFKVALNN